MEHIANRSRKRNASPHLDANGDLGDHVPGVRTNNRGAEDLSTRVLENGDLRKALGDALALAAVDLRHLALEVTRIAIITIVELQKMLTGIA